MEWCRMKTTSGALCDIFGATIVEALLQMMFWHQARRPGHRLYTVLWAAAELLLCSPNMGKAKMSATPNQNLFRHLRSATPCAMLVSRQLGRR